MYPLEAHTVPCQPGRKLERNLQPLQTMPMFQNQFHQVAPSECLALTGLALL